MLGTSLYSFANPVGWLGVTFNRVYRAPDLPHVLPHGKLREEGTSGLLLCPFNCVTCPSSIAHLLPFIRRHGMDPSRHEYVIGLFPSPPRPLHDSTIALDVF